MTEQHGPRRAETATTRQCLLIVCRGTSDAVRALSLALIVLALLGQISIVIAQPAQKPAEESTIAYRLAAGKTMHFDDAKKAGEHLATVKKLGCEVSEGEHEGHGDVAYRCLKWKALTVADDKLAHQWELWLKDAGFETLHGHAADDHDEHIGESKEHAEEHAHEHDHKGDKHEEVAYRIPGWVVLHPQKEDEAQELVAIVKGLGCEVREARHEGHSDVSFRCVEWKHIDLPSHEAAEAWQKWMTTTGFETRHEEE